MERTRVLVTGGAGFIGSNLVAYLVARGHDVVVYDNLSRCGAQRNLAWLRRTYGPGSFRLVTADVADFDALRAAARGAQRIYHLAGQVAVTTSIGDPRRDFFDNALGTLNALEAARQAGSDPIFLYASTNKVYGGLEDVNILEGASRLRFADLPFGIPETWPLDFHSPYGCSKGAGDQYTRDYARIYGLRTVVARQSCIYGYRQHGVEDQGWMAWFAKAALTGGSVTIFGSGKQVRDVLFIDDLLEFYEAAVKNIEVTKGQVFNVGGGPENTLSVWAEFGALLEETLKQRIAVTYKDPRPGDQAVYISDIRKAGQWLGWRPRVSVQDGIARLARWIQEDQIEGAREAQAQG